MLFGLQSLTIAHILCSLSNRVFRQTNQRCLLLAFVLLSKPILFFFGHLSCTNDGISSGRSLLSMQVYIFLEAALERSAINKFMGTLRIAK